MWLTQYLSPGPHNPQKVPLNIVSFYSWLSAKLWLSQSITDDVKVARFYAIHDFIWDPTFTPRVELTLKLLQVNVRQESLDTAIWRGQNRRKVPAKKRRKANVVCGYIHFANSTIRSFPLLIQFTWCFFSKCSAVQRRSRIKNLRSKQVTRFNMLALPGSLQLINLTARYI
jgi:hypothetical protein